MVIRELDPGQVPASCEACGKTDLDPENADTWDLARRFKSMIRRDPAGVLFVDYTAARTIAKMTWQPDPLFFLESIEAIKEGLNSEQQRSNPDRD